MQLNNNNKKNPIAKWAEKPNKHFPKDIQMGNEYIKRYSAPIITGNSYRNHNEISFHTC